MVLECAVPKHGVLVLRGITDEQEPWALFRCQHGAASIPAHASLSLTMNARAAVSHASRRKRNRLTSSRLRRSRLLTEVAMRKLNLDPEKTEKMELISDELAPEDISFFSHIFHQIDSTCPAASVPLCLRSLTMALVGAQPTISASSCARSCTK